MPIASAGGVWRAGGGGGGDGDDDDDGNDDDERRLIPTRCCFHGRDRARCRLPSPGGSAAMGNVRGIRSGAAPSPIGRDAIGAGAGTGMANRRMNC